MSSIPAFVWLAFRVLPPHTHSLSVCFNTDSSLLLGRRERICNLLAPIRRRNQHNHGAPRDREPERPRRLGAGIVAHRLLDFVEHQVHERVVAFECAGHCAIPGSVSRVLSLSI